MKKDHEITTRFASSADARIVHDMLFKLAVSMYGEHEFNSSVKDIKAALSGRKPDTYAIIAEKNGESVGVSVFFLTFSTWRGTRGVYVQDIFVAAGARGNGLGSRLLKEVVSWGTSQGADHLRLSVNRDNPAAHSFYKHLGLSFRDDEMIYAIVGDSFVNLGALS